MLAPRDRGDLQATLGVLGLDHDRNLIPNIAHHLGNAGGVSAALDGLAPAPHSLLRDILLLTPGAEFQPNVEQLRAAPGFKQLYDRALVGVGKGYMGGLTLLVPEEAYPLMLSVLYHWEVTDLAKQSVESVEAPRSNAGSFLRNVTTFIALAESTGFPLTRSGEIPKGILKKSILPYMELGEAAVGADRYPRDFGDVLAFARHFDFLRVEAETARPTDTAYSFLDAPVEDIIFALREFAGSRSRVVIADRILDLLAALPEQAGWAPVAAVLAALTSGIYPAKYRGTVKAKWQEAVEQLERLGLLEYGTAGKGGPHVRLGHLIRGAADGVRSTRFYVTPDFKVSAPRNLDFRIRHELFHYCRFVRADQMDQWEINRDSVDHSIDEGRDAAGICEFLARHSSNPLPGNVSESIRLWAAQHASLRYYHCPVLIVDDPREQKLVHALCAELGAAIESPAENVIILADAKADALLDRIRARRKINVLRPVTRKSARSFRDHVEENLAKKSAPTTSTD